MNANFLNASQKMTGDTPLTGDAGNRSYSRVSFEGSEEKYILCKYPEKEAEQLKDFLDVHNLFCQNSVNSPKVVEFSSHQMLLEDLGDQSLEDHFKSGGSPYSFTIDELVKIQKIPIVGDSKAQSYSFTVDKFVWEMDFTLTHFTQLFKMDLDDQKVQKLKSDFKKLCKHLCSLEQVITHRDFHSRNVMIKDNKPYIIDFQDARIGPKFYDLVSLIEDSYTNLDSTSKKNFINEYCVKTNITCDKNFMTNYHMQNLQRTFKACGSFASFKNRTNNERYLQYLKPAFNSLLLSCASVEGFDDLKDFIRISSEKWNLYEY